MSSGRGANLFWGSLHFGYVLLFSVLLPYWTVNALNNIVIGDYTITFGQEGFFDATIWLLRAGLIMAAFAFFKGTSPKYSRRRALGALLETAADIFYIFMYKFSGASNIHLHGPDIFVRLDMDQLLALYMGMILLYIVYNIWDLIDTQFFARERAEKDIKKQMEKKWKKIMKKEGYTPPVRDVNETDPLTSALAASKAPPAPTTNGKTEGDFLE